MALRFATASIIRLSSLQRDPPLAEVVKKYHACSEHSLWVCLSLHIARLLYLGWWGVLGGWGGRVGEGKDSIPALPEQPARCPCKFWCCWKEGCWSTTVRCKK